MTRCFAGSGAHTALTGSDVGVPLIISCKENCRGMFGGKGRNRKEGKDGGGGKGIID